MTEKEIARSIARHLDSRPEATDARILVVQDERVWEVVKGGDGWIARDAGRAVRLQLNTGV